MFSRKLSTAFQLALLFLIVQTIIFYGIPFWPKAARGQVGGGSGGIGSGLSQRLIYPWSKKNDAGTFFHFKV